MTTPTKLNGVTSCLKIDDIDMHTYGLIVTQINNPVPTARQVTATVDGLDGDLDFTKNIGPRVMSLSGSIIGNDHADLMANVDLIKSFFRLRQNGRNLSLIFQDQTDRYWTVRYLGGLQITPNGLWMYSRTASFSLQLKCVKPYSEATSITSETVFLSCLGHKTINNAGTMRTPLNVQLCPRVYTNQIPQTFTALLNCTMSDDSTNFLYSTKSKKASRTAGGAFKSGEWFTGDATKYYVCGAYAYTPTTMACVLAIRTVGGVDVTSAFEVQSEQWNFTFFKVQPSNISGSSETILMVENDGSNAWMSIAGLFMYEITAAEFADATFVPPPFIASAFVPPKNPSLSLHRSINIFPSENGEYVTANWSGNTEKMSIVSDPFGGSDKCLLFRSTSGATVNSPIMYVTGSKYYKLSFDYFVESVNTSQGILVKFLEYIDGKIIPNSAYFSYMAAGTAWATQQTERQATKASMELRLSLKADSDVKIYIKNIQLVRAAAMSEAFDTYRKPDIVETTYTGTINDKDDLTIDSDKVTADFYDNSALTTENAFNKLALEPLYLEPGVNTIRYTDARKGAALPEAESCGAVMAKLNYRKRFL